MARKIQANEVSVTRNKNGSRILFNKGRLSAEYLLVEIDDYGVKMKSCFSIVPSTAKKVSVWADCDLPTIFVDTKIEPGRYLIDEEESDDDTVVFYFEDKINYECLAMTG